jgi:hypothetical protein
MHKELESLENSPVTWAGTLMGYFEVPAGTDFSPLLQGLPDDKCQCPHWGYVFKGALHIGYTDGAEEVVKAGDVYYMPPGHTVWTTDEDTAILILGPEKEEMEVLQHMEKRQKELSQQGA